MPKTNYGRLKAWSARVAVPRRPQAPRGLRLGSRLRGKLLRTRRWQAEPDASLAFPNPGDDMAACDTARFHGRFDFFIQLADRTPEHETTLVAYERKNPQRATLN